MTGQKVMSMIRHRLLIRFMKAGDLRLISHRDLARAFERLFRRVGLPLAMSEGFHPHPRISFPSALALGIEGADEIVEVVLSGPVGAPETEALLAAAAPPGLAITSVRQLGPGEKSKVESATYEIRVPRQRLGALQAAIGRFLGSAQHIIERPGRKQPLDIRPGVQLLESDGQLLRMTLAVSQDYNVKPREVLAALDLQDLESDGAWLTRTRLGLESEKKT